MNNKIYDKTLPDGQVIPECTECPDLPPIQVYEHQLIERWESNGSPEHISNIRFLTSCLVNRYNNDILQYGSRIWSCRKIIMDYMRKEKELLEKIERLTESNNQLSNLCRKVADTTDGLK